jgi:hypothetical protein
MERSVAGFSVYVAYHRRSDIPRPFLFFSFTCCEVSCYCFLVFLHPFLLSLSFSLSLILCIPVGNIALCDGRLVGRHSSAPFHPHLAWLYLPH